MRFSDEIIRCIILERLHLGLFSCCTSMAWKLVALETGYTYSEVLMNSDLFQDDWRFYYDKCLEITNQLLKENIIRKHSGVMEFELIEV